ncbi:hypothetical protein AK830_g7103 [Neonectria ditissima]|uniref:Uncharacterized protein n=1 Tax=Neonectria ditissima TaxID=78410 RepID=A0A0P7AXY0_9HYPO|nr:hypothetical protein AK830_g7103 [Neonectria ditissima]
MAPLAHAVLDDQTTLLPAQFDTSTKISKTKNRPKSLTLSPFDPNELSHKLSTVASEQDDDSTDSMTSESQDSPKDDPMSKNTTPSPKTTAAKELSPKFSKQGASPASRRTSIFQHFSIKGSNYDAKKDDDASPKPAPYRHIPKNAAAQFAKTTTVSPLTEKAVVTKQVKSPGPGCMSNGTMSLQEYNKQSRRTQSLCHGRPPHDRNGNPFPLTVLESTAEVDEEPNTLNSRLSLQPNQLRGFDLANEMARRMSTGNMRAQQRGGVEVPLPVVVRNDATNLSVFRQSSIGSADNMSPFHMSSGPTSPLRQEFDQQLSLVRRSSDANSNPSRRSSVVNAQRATVVDMYRVDWSQSDQSKRRRDSRWSIMRGRIGSTSSKSDRKDSVSGESVEPGSPASPKAGFLGRFKL